MIAFGSNRANTESHLLERPGILNPSCQVCAAVNYQSGPVWEALYRPLAMVSEGLTLTSTVSEA